jgi:hypothetical protein
VKKIRAPASGNSALIWNNQSVVLTKRIGAALVEGAPATFLRLVRDSLFNQRAAPTYAGSGRTLRAARIEPTIPSPVYP